jgi:hypothetical protein
MVLQHDNSGNSEATGTAIANGNAVSTTIRNTSGSTYQLHRAVLRMLVSNDANVSTVTAYVYDSDVSGEGPPDDRVATADATFDTTSLTTSCSDVVFEFSTPATIPTGSEYQFVLYNVGDQVVWCGDSYIDEANGIYSRTGAPGSTNDSASWTETDSNGSTAYFMYQCE